MLPNICDAGGLANRHPMVMPGLPAAAYAAAHPIGTEDTMNRCTMAAAALLALTGEALAGSGSGTFSGLSGHETSGAVEVVQSAEGWQVRLASDFRFDGAPDPRVGFGRGGAFAEGTDFEVLERNEGEQVYSVPDGIDPAAFDEVYIWCRQYAVPLGVAPIR